MEVSELTADVTIPRQEIYQNQPWSLFPQQIAYSAATGSNWLQFITSGVDNTLPTVI